MDTQARIFATYANSDRSCVDLLIEEYVREFESNQTLYKWQRTKSSGRGILIGPQFSICRLCSRWFFLPISAFNNAGLSGANEPDVSIDCCANFSRGQSSKMYSVLAYVSIRFMRWKGRTLFFVECFEETIERETNNINILVFHLQKTQKKMFPKKN